MNDRSETDEEWVDVCNDKRRTLSKLSNELDEFDVETYDLQQRRRALSDLEMREDVKGLEVVIIQRTLDNIYLI